MGKRKLIYWVTGLSLLLIFMVGLVLAASGNRFKKSKLGQQQNSYTEFHDSGTGASFKYPVSLNQIDLSGSDKKDKFIFRAQNTKADSSNPVLITVRYEDGIAVAAKTTKQVPLDMLVSNVRKSYPSRYPGFSELSFSRRSYQSRQAAEVVFTYNVNGKVLKQKFVLVQLSEDRFVYFSFQSESDFYDQADNSYFNLILDSLKIK